MLPIDLVLVRHGQSEGNAAKRLSEAGDHSVFTKEFRSRHTASFRLTPKGRDQAAWAGRFLIKEFFEKGYGFQRYLTSDYVRAVETAGRMGLPKAKWYCDPYLTERDWGEMDICSEEERREKFGDAMRKREMEPFFWRPPNGESFTQLCMREDRVLHTLHRECSDKRVLIVCHGEVIRALEVRLERLSQAEFKRRVFSEESDDRIYNCQIIHYSRINPVTGELGRHANWVRSIRAGAQGDYFIPWREIVRPQYSNRDLIDIAEASSVAK